MVYNKNNYSTSDVFKLVSKKKDRSVVNKDQSFNFRSLKVRAVINAKHIVQQKINPSWDVQPGPSWQTECIQLSLCN